MNDQTRVCILDRLAHRSEQPDALIDRTLMCAAILVERLALHVLHHEIRSPIGSYTHVIQPRDKRMLQFGQRPDLARETFRPVGLIPGAPEKLNGYVTSCRLVFGQEHLSHTALANRLLQPVGAE